MLLIQSIGLSCHEIRHPAPAAAGCLLYGVGADKLLATANPPEAGPYPVRAACIGIMKAGAILHELLRTGRAKECRRAAPLLAPQAW